jgi:ferrous iron transport protein B
MLNRSASAALRSGLDGDAAAEADCRIVLIGNPNTGKSSIFNALTGAQQHVGNWPGKTVEKKVGWFTHGAQRFELIDLPGAYSLSTFTLEETVTRGALQTLQPDLAIVVVDAANLERNLYLAVQVLETGIPCVIALNMIDAAASRGLTIDRAQLAAALQAPVVPMVARQKQGIAALIEAVSAVSTADFRLDYGSEAEAVLETLSAAAQNLAPIAGQPNPRWLAIQLLEADETTWSEVQNLSGGAELCRLAATATERLEAHYGDEIDILIADRRYRWINEVATSVQQEPEATGPTLTERIDAIVTHRWLGLPIFLLAMWVVFKLTTDVAAPLVDWIAFVIEGPVTHWASALFAYAGLAGSWVAGLVVDGIIAGVGGVLVFVPVLAMLYLALALLEDSGYMARVAFVMDRLMRPFGLHGRSFLPMIVGFGCTVPAIYATRTLERRRDRVLTGLLVPFMSCSARLPVYVLFATLFFPTHAGAALFFIYLLGIVVAIGLGLFLQRTLPATEEESLFVLELPPYRLPTFQSIGLHAWRRVRAFIRKAWTVILGMSILVWALMAMQFSPAQGGLVPAQVEESLFANLSASVAPVFEPLGFGSWQATGSLLTGMIAKEVVISSLAQTYGVETDAGDPEPVDLARDLKEIGQGLGLALADMVRAVPAIFVVAPGEASAPASPTTLMSTIQQGFDASSQGHAALAGLAFMVFVLLYTPCMVAVAAMRHEFGAGWMWTSVIGQFGLAWMAAMLVFQIGLRLGF